MWSFSRRCRLTVWGKETSTPDDGAAADQGPLVLDIARTTSVGPPSSNDSQKKERKKCKNRTTKEKGTTYLLQPAAGHNFVMLLWIARSPARPLFPSDFFGVNEHRAVLQTQNP